MGRIQHAVPGLAYQAERAEPGESAYTSPRQRRFSGPFAALRPSTEKVILPRPAKSPYARESRLEELVAVKKSHLKSEVMF